MNNNLPEGTSDILASALGEIEGRLNETLKEIRRLRVQVRALEEENKRLRLFMFTPFEKEESHQQLLRFYQEGYHICPPHFARIRGSEGCIFCMNFMEKKGLLPNG